LQFPDHLIAPLFQLLGFGLVLGVAGFFSSASIFSRRDSCEAMRRASRVVGSRRWRGAYWNAYRSS